MEKFIIPEKMWESINRLDLSEEERHGLINCQTSGDAVDLLNKIIEREETLAINNFRSAQKNLIDILASYGLTEDQLMEYLVKNEEYEKCDTLIKSREILAGYNDYINRYLESKNK